MPKIWIKPPDTLQDLERKLLASQESKAALEICLGNMRKALIRNQVKLDSVRISERITAIEETIRAINREKTKILNLENKIKEKQK